MQLTVADDPALAALLTSPDLLAQTWPGVSGDVQLLLQVLRVSVPSLADALAVGLITLLAPPRLAATQVSVANRQAALIAEAKRRDGSPIRAPHNTPQHVEWLDITQVAVAGQTWAGETQ